MDIALYSNDPELELLCRDIARLRPGAKYSRKQDFRMPPDSPGATCIFDASLGTLQNLPERRNSILIVDRSDLEQVRGEALHLKSVVLPKPLTRAQLEIAIEQSMSHAKDPVNHDLLARLSRDDLMERVLSSNIRLQEFDRGRTHFLTRAVHELQAPLTSLNGYCELFLAGKLGQLSDEQRTVISRMLRSVTRLIRIVSTMLDLTVEQSYEFKRQHQDGNIMACVEQAVHEVSPVLRDRNLDLDLNLLPPVGPLSFDPLKMEQVFVNLLENSCKFVPRRGFIRIYGHAWFWDRRQYPATACPYPADRRRSAESATDEPAPNAYRVDITDNGPGILPSQIDHLFEEFTLYAGGSDRSGAGLGLAICRMIVSQHDGKIWAESPNAEGATFCVVIPHYVEKSTPVMKHTGINPTHKPQQYL